MNINVVMSGFAPYDDVAVNPAYEVPKALAEQGLRGNRDGVEVLKDDDIHITAITLPVSYSKAWPQLLATLERVQPHIVIATGLKHASRGILLERCATNVVDSVRPDVDNLVPQRKPIELKGPAAYWTRLPLRAILNDFTKHRIPATLSSDAGTYVCNALFYELLHWSALQEHRRVLAGFVSFPQVNEQPHSQHGLPLSEQIVAGRDVVYEAIHYYLQTVH